MNPILPEEISAIAGILLSLGFSYLPGLKDRFSQLEPTSKRLVMLGLLALVALGVFGLSCLRPGWLPGVTCSGEGAWELARIFFIAVVANQAAYELSPGSNRKAAYDSQA
jgi:hypothetical protein